MQRNTILYVGSSGIACTSCVLCREVVNGKTVAVTAGGFSEDVDRQRVGFLSSWDCDGPILEAGLLFDDMGTVVYVSAPITRDEVTALERAGFTNAYTFA